MTSPPASSRHVGLIGGLGVGAAVAYYRAIVSGCAERGVVPRLTIAHADAATVVAQAAAGSIDALADDLAGFVDGLAGAGAQLVAIPAVTPHIAIDALRRRVELPIVDILTTTTTGLRQRGVTRVALLGTRTTIESEMFGALQSFEVVSPTPHEIDEIDRVYVDVAANGHTSPANVDALRRIAETLLARDRLDAIVVAGTDLCVISAQLTDGLAAFDCAAAHIDAILEQAVSRSSSAA